MAQVVDYILFAFLVSTNLLLGLYFSFRQRSFRSGSAAVKAEVFLGSRTIGMLPLAASSVASLFSPTGLIGFTAHFYAYGWHMAWSFLPPLVLLPFATHVFVPVLYKLGGTSIFEYIRLRFNATISLTACVIYIFLSQSIGAISTFAASLTLVTVFKAPLFWCNIFIGLSGTFYTALGGLRGVVWTDCMQFLVILIAPTTLIANVIVDAVSKNSSIQPTSDMDLRYYIADFSFDPTNDETVWSCFWGAMSTSLYRLCLDQMVAQRLLASRTLHDARRTSVTSSVLLFLLYIVSLFMGVALMVWFRGCDPTLLGETESIDQILPHYINTYLVHIPGFVGLFLAGVVSAATSTVSSMINSQATILYIDVISRSSKKADQHVLWITRGTAILLGTAMTIYSTLCVYMGSVTRIFMMVNAALTGPFVGLCLLAALFPFVHSKGAGGATLITVIYQLCHMVATMKTGRRPKRMPVSLDYCPGNWSTTVSSSNTVNFTPNTQSHEAFFLFRLSYLWSSVLATFATVAIGVLLSALTGETKNPEQPELCSDLLTRIWRTKRLPCTEEKTKNVAAPKFEKTNNEQQEEGGKLLVRYKESDI